MAQTAMSDRKLSPLCEGGGDGQHEYLPGGCTDVNCECTCHEYVNPWHEHPDWVRKHGVWHDRKGTPRPEYEMSLVRSAR